ncbi:hypothetical protein NDU88_000636 [Pleurodeles waltl]|uniref:Uncharacterized protein n=1 Tax=Pleurodeles waltl TaxID=8319 RepID=A0AAV7UQJ0_PLEWA|nr:hypothetical protein NDU88_000636 [Pleurodeles waltl]
MPHRRAQRKAAEVTPGAGRRNMSLGHLKMGRGIVPMTAPGGGSSGSNRAARVRGLQAAGTLAGDPLEDSTTRTQNMAAKTKSDWTMQDMLTMPCGGPGAGGVPEDHPSGTKEAEEPVMRTFLEVLFTSLRGDL